MIRERTYNGIPGLPMLFVLLAAEAGFIWMLVMNIREEAPVEIILAAVLIAVVLFLMAGLFMVNPNEGKVLQLFGEYKGTAKVQGLRWANPFLTKKKVSLRVRNFESSRLKVNDIDGNPIEIAAVVVWRVTDTARAVFAVDDFVDYVHIQSESAVRQLARSYPYDSFEDDTLITLIGDTGEVNEHLLDELHERAAEAGVDIVEARLTDLSYAPEIAEAMLRRQQASAVVAARAKIVEGAVLMVREAIEALQGGDGADPIELDSERRATFAANLMTVIASDQPTSPVVNVGTLMR
jgi:regulator of protease activity HflC (stomatin/prohibitin superfamily)